MREGILYVVRHGVPTVSLRCTPPCAAVDLKPTHSCLSGGSKRSTRWMAANYGEAQCSAE